MGQGNNQTGEAYFSIAFQNQGRTWRRKGYPQRVNVHDFPSHAQGHAIPYGTYEVAGNRAVVNVGISHDTAEFAVESIRRWWKMDGRRRYEGAERVLIFADGRGVTAVGHEAGRSMCRGWRMARRSARRSAMVCSTVSSSGPGSLYASPAR